MSFEKRISLTGVEKLVYEVKGEMDKVIVAISLYLQNSEYTAIEFYSSLVGVTTISLKMKTVSTHIWESEELAQELSTANYHYTGKILDGVSNKETSKKIILDCLSQIKDEEVKQKIQELLKNEILLEILNS